jgi:glycosyltransferase involved in cell wall biosynthesis
MKKVVLVVLNNFIHDNRVLKEATSLCENGFDVSVCVLHENNLKEFEKIGKIKIFRLKLKSKNWPGNTFFRIFKYFEFLIRFTKKFKNSDIIHCNDLNALPFGVFLKKFYNKKIKIIYDAHEHETQREYNSTGIKHQFYVIAEKLLIKHADKVITVSPSIAREYSENYNIEKVYLVHNCPYYEEVSKQDLFRKELGISKVNKIFIYQGVLSADRGLLKIIEAFKQISEKKIAGYVIVFMGYGNLEEKIKSLSEKYDSIYYYPSRKQSDILQYTASADWSIIFIKNVSRSYFYSLPNKFFESIMASLPMIVSPLQEMSKFVKENKIGLVTKDFSTEALIETILKTDKDDQINQTSFKNLKQIYNWESQEKTLLEAYSEL